MADVGNHCVVAAGAVVTKAGPDFSIVAGVPAAPIGSRRKGVKSEQPAQIANSQSPTHKVPQVTQ